MTGSRRSNAARTVAQGSPRGRASTAERRGLIDYPPIVADDRLILAIEISNPTATEPDDAARGLGPGVALGWLRGRGEVEVIGSELLRASRQRGGHDDDLIPAIDRLFATHAIDRARLRGGAVAVSIGPGGYTGVRVACATGAMLAEAAGAAGIATPTAMVAAFGLGARASELGRYLITLAAKADSSWGQMFEGVRPVVEGRLYDAAELARACAGPNPPRALIADRHLPAPMRTEAERLGLPVMAPALSAVACLHAAALGGLPEVDPARLVPLYPREPDAVTLWRARANKR